MPESRARAMRRGAASLAAAGIPDAQADARLLLCAAARIERASLLGRPELALASTDAARFDLYLARRLAREPVSRILGRREFWGLDFALTPAVLDPRPDTETVVTAALEHAGAWTRGSTILDLGTGSGAILAALLSELPTARGIGVDFSAAACRVAYANLGRLGFGSRCLVVEGHWGSAVAPHGFDLVVSNPPYIATAVLATLQPDVLDYDPAAALDGGADGLDAIRSVVADLPGLLTSRGTALVEVGSGQAAAVAGLAAAGGLVCRGIHKDLAGIDRVVALGLPSPAAIRSCIPSPSHQDAGS